MTTEKLVLFKHLPCAKYYVKKHSYLNTEAALWTAVDWDCAHLTNKEIGIQKLIQNHQSY